MDATNLTRREVIAIQDAENTRRERFLQGLLPSLLSIVVLALGLVIILLIRQILPFTSATILLCGLFLVLAGSFLIARRATRDGHLAVASNIVVAATALGAVGIQLLWSTSQGLTPYSLIEFITFGAVIILAGVLGNQWIVGAVSVVLVSIAALVLLMVPPAHSFAFAWYQERWFVLPNVILGILLFTVIIIAIVGNNQRIVQDLSIAYERSRQLEELKDQFISSVNHELRSPLMTLQMYLQTATATSLTLPDLQQLVARSARASTQLVDLVQSILSVQTIDRDVVSVHPVLTALAPIVESARSLDHDSSERTVQIAVDPALIVYADPIRLQQVITNLLSNAAKYSAAPTPILVRATPSADGVELVVTDQGLGIPPDQAVLLFNRFARLPRDLASHIQGNGLGLYLCRRFLEAMGGQIWVASSGIPEEGTSMHVHLPTAPAPRS